MCKTTRLAQGGELRQAAGLSERPLNHDDAIRITVAGSGEVQDQAGRPRRKLADGGEQYPPMPKQDTNILEVLIGQVGECCDAYTVLGKALRVLGQTELFEPVGDLLHCRKPQRDRAYDVSDEDIRPNLPRELTPSFCPILA